MKIFIIILISLIISSCNYKMISPYCICDNNPNNINNSFTIGANSTEEEIKMALENSKKLNGKNIIIVKGYISSSSDIFNKIKNVIQNEKNIVLDLSNSSLDTANTSTFEGSSALITVILPVTELIRANFFKDCTSLINVSINSSTVNIDASSFSGCTSLKNVEYFGTSANIITGTPFTGTIKPTDLYLPNITKDTADNSLKNFLGADWVNIHYGVYMTK